MLNDLHMPLGLSDALITRMAHDLSGAAGAIGNGVELLADLGSDPAFLAEARGLLGQSAMTLNARLRFFRAAFGRPGAAVGGFSAARPIVDVYVSTGATKTRPVGLAWPEAEASPSLVQAALAVVMTCLDSLPMGGDIAVYAEPDGFRATASGPRLRLVDNLFAACSTGDAGADFTPTPDTAALAVAAIRLAPQGLRLECAGTDNELTVRTTRRA